MRLAGALLVSSLLLAGSASAVAATPAPFDIRVAFEFSDAAGEEGFREDLELHLLSELRRAACFRSVELDTEASQGEAPADRLRLRVSVAEVFEETTYDVSTAQRTNPNAGPGLDLAHTVRFRAQALSSLEHVESGRALRSRPMTTNGAYRPRMQGEDARHVAREQAIVEMVRRIRVFACKRGLKRLNKELGAQP